MDLRIGLVLLHSDVVGMCSSAQLPQVLLGPFASGDEYVILSLLNCIWLTPFVSAAVNANVTVVLLVLFVPLFIVIVPVGAVVSSIIVSVIFPLQVPAASLYLT